MLKKAREEKHLTQEQLAQLADKKRTYISRVELTKKVESGTHSKKRGETEKPYE